MQHKMDDGTVIDDGVGGDTTQPPADVSVNGGGAPPPTGAGGSGTGGLDLPTLLRLLSQFTGGAAGSALKQNNIVDALKERQWESNQALGLARDKFAVNAPGARLAQSTKASLESNFTPTKVQWNGPGSGLKGELPTITGGAAAGLANLDPRTKALASSVMDDTLAGQRNGGITGGGADARVGAPPTIGDTSLMDKLLGGAGIGTGLLSAIADALKKGSSGAGAGSNNGAKTPSRNNGNPAGRNGYPFSGPRDETDPGYFSGPQQETDPGYFSGPRQETDPGYFEGPIDPNVSTDYFMGWPETSDPFSPFNPDDLGGDNG